MNKDLLKKLGAALGVVALFLALSYGFVPQVLEGKIVNQSDISGFVGMSHEMSEWNANHPDNPTYWTDSMFGGMPTTAISTQNGGDYSQSLYNLLFRGKRPATFLFVALLGAFLMFLALGASVPVAIGGAIAVAFCSYNFQIIQVGHNTKMQAIALFPWVMAALVYTYKSSRNIWKTLLGAALFGLTLSFQVKANHQQITYYLAIVVIIYALVELVHTIKTRDWKPFLVASALLLVLGLTGIATNTNKLLPLAKYTAHTMRGGSELSKEGANAGGLDLDYATSWSYGWEELPNLMIPNFNGGSSSGAVDPNKSETIRVLKEAGQRNIRETAKVLPLYWGPQPFTAGPMYMGAVTVFLFVLGLFLYKGRNKWWLIAATVLAILLAVGSHFMAFTKLCFQVLPLYNKFRTVSMALVILQVTLPVLGFLTLDQMLKDKIGKKEFRKGVIWSAAITGGFCLLCWLVPGLFGSFTSDADAAWPGILVEALMLDRIALFKADALLSFVLIAVSAVLLFWATTSKGWKWVAAIAVCVLSAANLFIVGKRYLNADDFTTRKDFSKPFVERPVDQAIKADEDPQYRVLDLTVDVFNSSVPSYHHKNVGGYSPAKLQRYQDLIEHYLSGEINGLRRYLKEAEDLDAVADWMATGTPVLNALNTRYVILDADFPPVENYSAQGPAWFVDEVVEASGPDEEIALVGSADLRRQAVIDSRSFPGVTDTPGQTGDFIQMTSYAPNELHYQYQTGSERLAVFSEIYYPNGWHATVDGEPVNLVRADWTLRAAVLPAGAHELVMTFLPDSYRQGALVSRITSLLLIVLVLLSVGLLLYNEWKPKNE
jgi:hypothetical protein